MSIDLKKTIRALRKGNQLAGFQLYQAFSKSAYNSILRLVQDEEQAKDLLQETFIHAFQKIDELNDAQAFGGWLKRIAINQALGQLRRKASLEFPIEEGFEIASEEEMEIPELEFELIAKAINALPAGCRTVFQLYYLEEYSHKDISEELQMSVSNSKTQLRYAKQLLQNQLKSPYETR